MKYRYLSDAITQSRGGHGSLLRQTLLLATTIFLVFAPWPGSLDIAKITAGFISG